MVDVTHIVNSTRFKMNNIMFESKKPRTYLGASTIGDECYRKLYYNFHLVSKRLPTTGKKQRIFDVGHLFEDVIKSNLSKIGVTCFADQEKIVGFGGHVLGHIDGIGIGFPEFPAEKLLLEFKSSKDEWFKLYMKLGLFAQDKKYFGQVQRYMGAMKLNKCAFIMINKNDCSLYVEFVDFDKSYYDDLLRKEREIIITEFPPVKAFGKTHFNCRELCNNLEVCHNGGVIEKNCRTCASSEIEDKGGWGCNNKKVKKKKDNRINFEEQLKGCGEWSKGWGLN